MLMVFACGVSPRTDFILIILCRDVLPIKHFGNNIFTIYFRICNFCLFFVNGVGYGIIILISSSKKNTIQNYISDVFWIC